MSLVTEQQSMRNPRAVLHWYDFLCPYCYIGQSRNAGALCNVVFWLN
jgi:predicted DsbA family dithiol-disulfide isomerase